MTAYLISGAIGLAGLGGGAVLALWWRYKLARSEALATGLKKDNASLLKDNQQGEAKLLEALQTNASLIKEQKAELVRRDREMEVVRAEEKRLRDLLRKYADDPAVAAERLGSLFPVSKPEGTGSGGA